MLKPHPRYPMSPVSRTSVVVNQSNWIAEYWARGDAELADGLNNVVPDVANVTAPAPHRTSFTVVPAFNTGKVTATDEAELILMTCDDMACVTVKLPVWSVPNSSSENSAP